jgi:hypothetical protein
MLTDAALRALKPKEKDFKVADRDGMYVHVPTKGAMSFRMDYRLNGRRETLYLGRYGSDGISLARAREKCTSRRIRRSSLPLSDAASRAVSRSPEKHPQRSIAVHRLAPGCFDGG